MVCRRPRVQGRRRKRAELSFFARAVGDRFLERVVADRAVHHPVADDEQRRAGRAELAGNLEIALQLGLDRRVVRGGVGDAGGLRRVAIGLRRRAGRRHRARRGIGRTGPPSMRRATGARRQRCRARGSEARDRRRAAPYPPSPAGRRGGCSPCNRGRRNRRIRPARRRAWPRPSRTIANGVSSAARLRVQGRRILAVAKRVGRVDEDLRIGQQGLAHDPSADQLRRREHQQRRRSPPHRSGRPRPLRRTTPPCALVTFAPCRPCRGTSCPSEARVLDTMAMSCARR